MKRGKRVLSLVLCLAMVSALAVPAGAAEPYTMLEHIAYYGDRSKCAMSAEQAQAFLDRIEAEKSWENSEMKSYVSYENTHGYGEFFNYAALFDLGNGIPALFFTRAYSPSNSAESLLIGDHSIWLYENGTTVPFKPDFVGTKEWSPWIALTLYDGYICASYEGWKDEYNIYPFSEGKISTSPSTTARSIQDENDYESIVGYEVDGKKASKSQYSQWVDKWANKWEKNPLAWGSLGTIGADYGCRGLTPIDDVKIALGAYITAAQGSTRVQLHLNGGSGGSALWSNASGTVQVPTNPTREGYTFAGWYTDEGFTTPWNFNSAVTGELTLYAKWTPVSSTATTVGQNTQDISFNGNKVAVQGYTLRADNGGDVTYVKLRDIAALMDGTSAQFNVDWRNGAIYVERGKAYTTRNGTELKPITGTDGSYQWNTAPILFDGTTTAMEGIVLEGTDGNHTFLKLRDLADAIGFTVGWSAEAGITIEAK